MSEELKQLEIAWRHFYVNATFDKKFFKNIELHPIIVPHTMEVAVSQLTNMIAGERIKEITYPLNWVQAFRERWFPKFILRRWPVKYHIWKVDLLYPEIDARKDLHPTYAIYSNQKSSGYPHFEDTPQEYKDLEED